MSGPRRSAVPIRQLSLQQPAPRRQQIRRQRSADDDKCLQIHANPIARGKFATDSKNASDRPKVRVAWGDNRNKAEKQLDQVEVVARQIPSRSRPTTGRFRGFANEKASILYSRQELAERLRLAWKHREANKANIDIFLAHGTLEERCESALSSCRNFSSPPTPQQSTESISNGNSRDSCSNSIDIRDKEIGPEVEATSERRNMTRVTVRTKSVDEDKREILVDAGYRFSNVRDIVDVDEYDNGRKRHDSHDTVPLKNKQVDGVLVNPDVIGCSVDLKKRISINVETNSLHDEPSDLQSSKLDESSEKSYKVERLTAKQKRMGFRSGTNRAFLGPVKCTENKYDCTIEKPPVQKIVIDDKSIDESSLLKIPENANNIPNDKNVSTKKNPVIERAVTPDRMFNQVNLMKKRSEKHASSSDFENRNILPSRTTFSRSASEIKSVIDKPAPQRMETRSNSTLEKNTVIKNTGESNNQNDKIPTTRSASELRFRAFERNSAAKKLQEKGDQKSRRTSSAPPHRNLLNSTPNNRLQVNIVIDTPGTSERSKKSITDGFRQKFENDCTDVALDRSDSSSPRTSGSRSIRSAPLKKRTKSSTKRRFSSSSYKNDEDAKSRNRSRTRTKNSIDSKTIDVVTMVSLVSSADSDSDIENSPSENKLINELRSKLPTTPIIKSSVNTAPSTARKPMKSVSFQSDSFDDDTPREQVPTKEEKRIIPSCLTIVNYRGNGGGLSSCDNTVSWRTETTGLPLPIATLVHEAGDIVDAPLTDREKRCLAVPIGELHDKKLKLGAKARNTSSRPVMEKQTLPMDVTELTTLTNVSQSELMTQNKTSIEEPPPKIVQTSAIAVKEVHRETRETPTEPRFQTVKEKECWHLYKKMCDKGVYVSFDTVLRGMLTPTEYRLRQRAMSQDL